MADATTDAGTDKAGADAITTTITDTKTKADTTAAEGAAATTLATAQDDPGAAKSVVQADWPEDWRDRMSGGNEEVAKLIKRFTSPVKAAEALFNARRDLSTRPKALATDATPEQVTAWRAENGIPEKPEGYLEKLPDGLIIGEQDKPLVGKFAEAMHAANESPATVHRALTAYYQIQQEQAARAEEANETAKTEGMESLMAEWGGEFRANKTSIANMLNAIPEDARNAISQARDADGVLLFNKAPVIRALAQWAKDLSPYGSVAVAGNGDPGKNVEARIKEIEKAMGVNGGEVYWKDNAMQAEYRELLTARDRAKARA